MFFRKKLIRLPQLQMMLREHNQQKYTEIYACRTKKDLVSKKEEIKCNN